MKKKHKRLISICVILGTILCLLFLCLGGVGGVKKLFRCFKEPTSYTWEEYEQLSNEEKDDFYLQFSSPEEFEDWKNGAQQPETPPEFQWNDPDRQPDAYTWEEYQSLTPEEQEAFYQWFGSNEAFESWKNQTKPTETQGMIPTWKDQEKQPDEYSWEEYRSLSPEEQDAFFLWFASVDAFEAWMNAAKPTEWETQMPAWNNSGKTPDQYTWAEYQALSPEEQDAFFLWFASVDAFEAWMDAVQPDETEPGELSWSKSGKTPDQYTWEEYQSLTPEEQDAFFLWFEDMEAFEAWAEQVEPQ